MEMMTRNSLQQVALWQSAEKFQVRVAEITIVFGAEEFEEIQVHSGVD